MPITIVPATLKVNQAITKDKFTPGTLTVSGQDYALEIHGHGHGTWGMPKKPYKIKLKISASLLGMKSSKHWVLLANSEDHTFINTALAFSIGQKLAPRLPWTPDSRFVELTLNNVNVGVYQLAEFVELASTKVNHSPANGTSGPGLTGTYLMEINKQGNKETFVTPNKVSIIWDHPDGTVPEQKTYIQDWIIAFEAALFASDAFDRKGSASYRSMINMDSFAAWYLVEELGSNQDSAFNGSCRIYKTADIGTNKPGQLFMGPLWDFDLSFGNCINESHNADEFYVRVPSTAWIYRMFSDDVFFKKVQEVWTFMKSNIIGSDGSGMITMMQAATDGIGPDAMLRDQKKWDYSYSASGNWSFVPIDYNLFPTKSAWTTARFNFLEKNYGTKKIGDKS